MSVWDDPELRAGGDFVKLEAVGDQISGVITAVRSHRFDDGGVAPQVLFTDDTTGDERTWTAGQIQAKRKLAELRPEVGDWFKARLANIEKRSGGKTLKHIEIEVSRGGKPTPRMGEATPAQPSTDGDLSDVLGKLSPEQRAALMKQTSTAAAPPF